MVYRASLAGTQAKALNKDLIVEARRLVDVDREGLRWSAANYAGGYTSYGSMDRLHEFSSTFGDLRKKIDGHVKKFVRELELDISPYALQMTSCWVNVMPAGVTHSMHLHPLSVLSGTYYVQTPPGSGALKFEDPRMDCFMASPPRKLKASTENQRHVSMQPKAGELILFESWMRHEVPAHKGKTPRISISFNYDWVGR